MSEWYPQVVRIDEIEAHPNADRLGIVRVLGNYPVCVNLADWSEGDVAAYVPVDTLVPNAEPFKFLFEEDDPADKRVRVRAKKLRGVLSMGLLVPPPAEFNRDGVWDFRQRSVQELFDLEKWEPERRFETRGDQVSPPDTCFRPPRYDVEGLRANAGVLYEGEEVIFTEKIHGANMRVLQWNGKLFVGGRNTWQRYPGNTVYAVAFEDVDERLASLLDDWDGVVFYGEVYGKVQDLRYGLENHVECKFFDAFDTAFGEWKSWDWLVGAFSEYDVIDLVVPELYRGPWSEALAYEHAEGPAFRGNHPREGIVIRPAEDRWDDAVGRVMLKLVGEGYQTR